MSEDFVYFFVHGFLEHKHCRIGLKIQKGLESYGFHVKLLDAKGGRGHFDCSVSIGLDTVESCYQKHNKPLRLIGTSMGGFISALYAAKHPDRVNRLVLLNPAFSLESNWLNILGVVIPEVPAEVSMKKWKEEGQQIMQGLEMEKPEPISYSYVADSLTYPSYPLITLPALVFTGRQDLLIPFKTHHEWKKLHPDKEKIEIIELEDDHEFSVESSWEAIIPAIVQYFS